MKTASLGLALALTLPTLATSAHAQDDVAPFVEANVEPVPDSSPGLTLPAGKIALSIAVQANSAKASAGDPVSIAPDVAYGVTDSVTVALAHSTQALAGFWSGSGSGSICIAGESCGKIYNTGALLTKVGLVRGNGLAVAALGGLVYNVDPFRLGLGLGGEAMYQRGRVSFHAKPTIYIGLNEREGTVGADGMMTGANKEFLNLPVAVLFSATPAMNVGIQSGVAAPLDGFTSAYRVPVAVMGTYALPASMSAGLALSLDRVVGADEGPGAMDARSLTLTVGWVR